MFSFSKLVQNIHKIYQDYLIAIGILNVTADVLTLYINKVNKIRIKMTEVKKIISNLQDKAKVRRNLYLYPRLFMKQKNLFNFNLKNNLVRKRVDFNIFLKNKKQLFELKMK